MVSILTWLAGAFASAIGYSVVRFTALKFVAWALMVTVLPIILTNFIYSLVEGAISLANQAAGQYGVQGYIMQLTGLAAWLANQLRVPEGLSLLLSAVMFRVVIRLIPFIRL